MDEIKVTFLTATWNAVSAGRGDALSHCVRSVASCSFPHEHLISDGGSQDGTVAGGMMLGKARRNGIILWGDDIDVIMMRNEYEKLKKIAADEFKDSYFLQNEESAPEACIGSCNILTGLDNGSTVSFRHAIFTR